MMNSDHQVRIFTDGCCLGNPGPGGYAAVLLYRGMRRELAGGYRWTTNNRMELLAAIKGLEWLTHPYRVAVYSDSQYLVNGAQRSRGKIKKNKPNPDLWERLVDACAGHQVTFEWIRGHSKIPGNERCDELAKAAARGQELEVDVGYEEKVHCQPNRGPVPTCREATVIGVGKPCPDCGCLCEQRRPKKKPKPDQKYYYEYYLFCPDCRKVYMPPEARHALG